eukprot:TRINITY_DN5091_c0_g1_i2.p1 TRINITY_DN5091_c0_g1~~TRINITY_DN5091_c0_g1_i2.p1  ORF type:complete len:302 (+),score=72.63 TRINITY_DN5091_c0_g1_i2:268-1173(+)
MELLQERLREKRANFDYDKLAKSVLVKRARDKIDGELRVDEEYDMKIGEAEVQANARKERQIRERMERVAKREKSRVERVLSSCKYCLANQRMKDDVIVGVASSVYMTIGATNRFPLGSFQIIPIEHSANQTAMEDTEYEEVRNFIKSLIACYKPDGWTVVSFETTRRLQKLPHAIIEVAVIPIELLDDVKLHFRKALLEVEGDWTTHRKIFDVVKEKGGIRKQIPKGFPYFYIDFDTKFGYAHIIEKEEAFSATFAEEIIGDLLKQERATILYPKPLTPEELAKAKLEFRKRWSPFDFTS